MEDALKEHSISSLREITVKNLILSSNVVKNHLQQQLKPFGITAQQLKVLRILEEAGEKALSTVDIRLRMPDFKPDVSRIVNRLVRKKYIVRKMNDRDKRLVDVRLSLSGKSLLDKLDNGFNDNRENLGMLSDDEVNQLNDLLLKIIEK